jgi:hypothetical protein
MSSGLLIRMPGLLFVFSSVTNNRPHYGTEFRIELVDATTDRTIGTGLITTQGLLQQQRDYLIEDQRVPFITFLRPIRFTDVRRLVIELRAGVKSGFSFDFYAQPKGTSSDGEAKPGRCGLYIHKHLEVGKSVH